jgi:hypothetical protein
MTSAYLSHDLDKPPPIKEMRDGVNHYNSRKSLSGMPMHTTFYGTTQTSNHEW